MMVAVQSSTKSFHPVRDATVALCACTLFFAETILVIALLNGKVPSYLALFLHLMIGGLPFAVATKNLDDDRRGWLVLLGALTFAFGPLGTLGFYLVVGFKEFHVDPDSHMVQMLRMLLPEKKESFSKRVVDEIRYNPELTGEEKDVTPFSERIRLGTSEQKSGVLLHIGHHYMPEFGPLVRECLQDPDPVIRVQAATVMNKIAHRYQQKLFVAQQEYEKNANSRTLLLLAGAYEVFSFSGVIDQFTEKRLQEDAIRCYQSYLENNSDQREVKRVYGRLLHRNRQWKEAFQVLNSLYEEGHRAPNEMAWLIETAYHLGKFSLVRSLTQELSQLPEALELPLEIAEVLALWTLANEGSRL